MKISTGLQKVYTHLKIPNEDEIFKAFQSSSNFPFACNEQKEESQNMIGNWSFFLNESIKAVLLPVKLFNINTAKWPIS